jgi:DNA-binding MarR family transcriptional regulator
VLLAIKAHQNGDATQLGVLAERLQTDRQTLVEIVDGLVRRRLVRRERDASDRRRVLISLTTEGEDWIAAVADDMLDNLAKGGTNLFRALRTVMSHAAQNQTRQQAPTRGVMDLDAWRNVAPAVV